MTASSQQPAANMCATAANSLASLKLSFNGEIRRLSVDTHTLTYPDLIAKTLSVFPHLTSIQFSWVDDEDDKVVISSNEELSEALRVMACEYKGYLRFEVVATSSSSAEATAAKALGPFIPPLTFGTITHAGIVCDRCGASPLTGPRFKCSVLLDYDMCASCEASAQQPYPMIKIYRPEQALVGIKVIVDEDRSRRHWGRFGDPNGMCHRGVCCNGCHVRNFRGHRFKCTVRNDYDLCEACEGKDNHEHAMVKIYSHQARMQIVVVPTNTAAAVAAAAQFHQGLFGLSGRGGRYGSGYHGQPHLGPPPIEPPIPFPSRIGDWGRGQRHGGHCWDGASVARAADNRRDALHHATVKEEQHVHEVKEVSRLEEELDHEKEMLASSDESLSSDTTAIQPEPATESSSEEKTSEKSEITTLSSLTTCYKPPEPIKLMACFVRDVTMPDGSEIAPHSTFFKTWRVLNDGKDAWPEGCHLVSAGGDRLLHPKLGEDFVLRHPVPTTAAGEEVELTLELCAPDALGRHVGYFRLQCPNGGYFGQRLWADIRVHADDMSVSMTLVPWEVLDSSNFEEKEGKSEIITEVIPTTEKNRQDPGQTAELGTFRTNEDESDLLEDAPHLKDKQDEEFDAAVKLWSEELRVMSDMGFHDFEQLLPVLQTHIQVPASQREENWSQEPGSEAGLQAVVLALLSGQD